MSSPPNEPSLHSAAPADSANAADCVTGLPEGCAQSEGADRRAKRDVTDRRGLFGTVLDRARQIAQHANAKLAAVDPNDDPNADALTLAPVVVLAVVSLIHTWLFFRWRIQPLQDWGHHLAMIAVIADYNNPASIYPAIYNRFDPLNTNSLLYTVGGYLGRLIGASLAARIALGSYFLSMPAATLYGLRVFGRSPWVAMLAVPLCYDMSYVSGFANFTFAAPLFVLATALFYRLLRKPSLRLGVINAVLLALLFLAHVHVFLWTGIVLFAMTIAFVSADALRAGRRQVRARTPFVAAGAALGVVIPALTLFLRWYHRVIRGPGPDDLVSEFGAVAPTWKDYVARLKPLDTLFADAAPYLHMVHSNLDLIFYVLLAAGALIALSLGAGPARKHPPVLECICALTIVSYFFMPEDFAGQGTMGSRQLGLGLHFAPALFSPTWKQAPWGRRFIIALVAALTAYHLWFWSKALIRFERDEGIALQRVLDAAPPRLRLRYVNSLPTSKHVYRMTFWHVDKWYMAEKYGQCPDNPAMGSMSAIRYKKTYKLVRIPSQDMNWFSDPRTLDNFDLVLTRLWNPTAQDLATAQNRATLISKQGDYQLWRIKH